MWRTQVWYQCGLLYSLYSVERSHNRGRFLPGHRQFRIMVKWSREIFRTVTDCDPRHSSKYSTYWSAHLLEVFGCGPKVLGSSHTCCFTDKVLSLLLLPLVDQPWKITCEYYFLCASPCLTIPDSPSSSASFFLFRLPCFFLCFVSTLAAPFSVNLPPRTAEYSILNQPTEPSLVGDYPFGSAPNSLT